MSYVRGGEPTRLNSGWIVLFWACAVPAALLTIVVRRTELLAGEAAAMRWVSTHFSWAATGPTHVLDPAFTGIAAPTIFAVLVFAVWACWGRWPAAVFFVAGSTTGLTKIADLAPRPRPTDSLEWGPIVLGSGGYPSGHVVYMVVVFGMLAHHARRHGRTPFARRAVPAASVALIAVTGPSRLAESDHWPADVVAGYLIGLSAFAGAVWVEHHAPGVIQQRAARLHEVLHIPATAPTLGRPADQPWARRDRFVSPIKATVGLSGSTNAASRAGARGSTSLRRRSRRQSA